MTVVRAGPGAPGRGAAPAVGDALAAGARGVGRAVADRVLALGVLRAADVDRAVGDRGDRLAIPVIRSAGARAAASAGNIVLSGDLDALAARALAVRGAVAVRVCWVAGEGRALVAAGGRARIRRAAGDGDPRAHELAVVPVPAARPGAAAAAARQVVLAGDLHALAAQALVVVRTEATAARRALAGRPVAVTEGRAREPRGRGAGAAAVRTGTTPVSGARTRACVGAGVALRLRHAGSCDARCAWPACVGAAPTVAVVGHEVEARAPAVRVRGIAREPAARVRARPVRVGHLRRALGAACRAVVRIGARVDASSAAVRRRRGTLRRAGEAAVLTGTDRHFARAAVDA